MAITIEFEGRGIVTRHGLSVAAALLAANEWRFRTTPGGGAPRGPYCMVGACFDCLVVVDGVANVRACMVEVRDGMRIERQTGAPAPGAPDSR